MGIIFIANYKGSDYQMNVEKGEALAYTKLRKAITTSAVDNTGTMTNTDFNTIKSMVKNQDSNNQWFSSNLSTCVGKIIDTTDNQITVITDGTYVAKFTVKTDEWDYYLVDYTFEVATINNGSQFTITP